MQQQPRKLTFKERVQAFLDHLEIARLEIGVLHTGAECLRRNIDAFCAFVSNVVKPCCDEEPVDEITVRGRIAMKAEPDMARIASDKLFEDYLVFKCSISELINVSDNQFYGLLRNEFMPMAQTATNMGFAPWVNTSPYE